MTYSTSIPIHLTFLHSHSTPKISSLKTSLPPPYMASPPSVSVSMSVSKSDTNPTRHDSDILHEFLFFNVYKDGRITIFAPPMHTLPAKDDPTTGVQIKDVQISDHVTVRMFHPPTTTPAAKLPVLLYVHGGGFCMQSAFSVEYTRFLTRLVLAGKIIAVSVEYGLFPARPIPACYEDSWEALSWVVSESGFRSDPWASHAELTRVYIAGDSAGGNICHTLAARAGMLGLPARAELKGAILIHPYFGEDDKMWMYMCPTNEGPKDPRMKPAKEDLARTGCEKVLVILGEKDGLREAGEMYADELIKSGWSGNVEVMVNKDRDHCFHLGCPDDLEAFAIQNRIISFIHHDGHNQ